uniref:Myosin-7B n=1 Tax=Oncorhynchus kisutch TaxID=8019 RepID=A0A8C7HCQ1_ONCKI
MLHIVYYVYMFPGQAALMLSLGSQLTALQSQMAELKKENAAQAAELSDLKNRVTTSESQVAELKNRVTTSESQVAELKNRVTTSESQVAELKNRVTTSESQVAELKNRVTTSESQVAELKKENAALEARLSVAESQVEELRLDRRQVAFSVGLTDSGYVGPFQTEITLVYEKIFTNIGNGYDTNSGMFSAPVRGVYYFTFTSMGREPGQKMGVYLVKNGEQMIYNVQDNFHGGYEYMTGAVALELEKDDLVYLRLPKGWGLYDDNYNHIVFTGILLFTTNPAMGRLH